MTGRLAYPTRKGQSLSIQRDFNLSRSSPYQHCFRFLKSKFSFYGNPTFGQFKYNTVVPYLADEKRNISRDVKKFSSCENVRLAAPRQPID